MNVDSMDPTQRPTLADRLLARPGCESAGTTVLQVVFLFVWPVALFLGIAMIAQLVDERARQFWSYRGFNTFTVAVNEFGLPEQFADRLLVLSVFLCINCLALACGFAIHAVLVHSDGRSVRTFLRRTWRAALPCLVLMPCIAYVLIILPPAAVSVLMPLVVLISAGTILFGSVIVARCERSPRRVSRHRPTCQECGYSLQHMTGLRCPECGEAYPTTHRIFRRWALRRLRWDRTQRGVFPAAWLATVFSIFFRPAAAGASISMPDRLGRAVRWAAANVLVVGLAGGLFLAALGKLMTLYAWFFVPEQMSFVAPDDVPSAARRALWLTQRVIAWIVVVCAYPAVALLLVWLMHAISPAARRTLLKWTFYSTAVIPVVYALVLAADASLSLRAPWWASTSLLNFPYYVTRPPELLVALLFGWIWASGVSRNRWIKGRGCETRLMVFTAYVLAWLFLTQVAFRPGTLIGLL